VADFRVAKIGVLLASAVAAVGLSGCVRPPSDRTPDGRIIVDYWEKWTGFEGEAMQAVVDDFNRSQNRIFVRKLTVSQIDRKMMLATAGGNPPDVAGLWSFNIPVYAEKGALTPLNRYLEEAGITADDYIPVFWELCSHEGFVWALPSTPATLALHWNKKMFREAGLDPEQPPRSIAELDRMAEQITLVVVERNGKKVKVHFSDLTEEEKRSKKFDIIQLGFVPTEPGWWNPMWGYWFGAGLWNGKDRITADSPENIEAFRWFQSYPKKYGLENLRRFGASFGNFASPQNPFLSGKVAMELQGVWMYNFIDKYAPQLEWGAAPFPAAHTDQFPYVTIAECDVLVIPRGARHVKEAFEFIRYVNTQPAMEKLCMGQRKFSPLSRMSEDFIRNHPNPYIKIFIEMARSPYVRTVPQTPIWMVLGDEMNAAVDRIFSLIETPAQALRTVQKRVQLRFDRERERWLKIRERRIAEWRGL